MANSTQAAAVTPALNLLNESHQEAMHIANITIDVSSYAVGGFPRLDVAPPSPTAASSFKKFFESLLGYEVGVIMNVELVSITSIAAVSRYDDVLDRVKLFDGALVEVANAVDAGDVRLRVWYT